MIYYNFVLPNGHYQAIAISSKEQLDRLVKQYRPSKIVKVAAL